MAALAADLGVVRTPEGRTVTSQGRARSRRQVAQTIAPERDHWLIQGFDGLSPIGEWRIDGRDISTDNVQLLIRSLAARAGLTFDEIVGAHLSGRRVASNGLLDVRRDGPRLNFTCGANPHFVASFRRGR
jgi:hypothetical protein